METDQRIAAGIGLCAMVFGVGVLAVPSLGTIGPLGSLQLSGSVTGRLLLVAGTAVVGYLLVGLREHPETGEQSAASHRFDRATSNPPEAVRETQQSLRARDIDAAIESGGPAYTALRDHLRESVVAVYTDVHGTTETAARRAVSRGEWCQDRVANRFLASEDGPTPTPTEQLRLLLLPERERCRRIDRTITAIETVQQR